MREGRRPKAKGTLAPLLKGNMPLLSLLVLLPLAGGVAVLAIGRGREGLARPSRWWPRS